MEQLTLDYLPNHIDIKLYQHKKMFRINTDTCLLGEFLDFEPNLEILDIGTNNAALLLYGSLLNPKKIIGIDINKEALEIAKKNLELNNVSNFELLECDANNFNQKMDIIISNPPYFVSSEDLKNKNEYLKMARHEEYLTLKDLVSIVARNLKETGYFYLVHRYTRLNDIKNELLKNNLFINKQRIVFDQNKVDPVSVLLKISFNKSEIIEDKLTVTR